MRLIEVPHHEVEQGKTVRQRMAEEETVREKARMAIGEQRSTLVAVRTSEIG